MLATFNFGGKGRLTGTLKLCSIVSVEEPDRFFSLRSLQDSRHSWACRASIAEARSLSSANLSCGWGLHDGMLLMAGSSWVVCSSPTRNPSVDHHCSACSTITTSCQHTHFIFNILLPLQLLIINMCYVIEKVEDIKAVGHCVMQPLICTG